MDLVDQFTDLRAVLEFPDIVQFVEAQRLDRQAVLRLRAAQALDQPHLDGAALAFVLSHAAGTPPSCRAWPRSDEHTSVLQSLMRTSFASFCLKYNNQHLF